MTLPGTTQPKECSPSTAPVTQSRKSRNVPNASVFSTVIGVELVLIDWLPTPRTQVIVLAATMDPYDHPRKIWEWVQTLPEPTSTEGALHQPIRDSVWLLT